MAEPDAIRVQLRRQLGRWPTDLEWMVESIRQQENRSAVENIQREARTRMRPTPGPGPKRPTRLTDIKPHEEVRPRSPQEAFQAATDYIAQAGQTAASAYANAVVYIREQYKTPATYERELVQRGELRPIPKPSLTPEEFQRLNRPIQIEAYRQDIAEMERKLPSRYTPTERLQEQRVMTAGLFGETQPGQPEMFEQWRLTQVREYDAQREHEQVRALVYDVPNYTETYKDPSRAAWIWANNNRDALFDIRPEFFNSSLLPIPPAWKKVLFTMSKVAQRAQDQSLDHDVEREMRRIQSTIVEREKRVPFIQAVASVPWGLFGGAALNDTLQSIAEGRGVAETAKAFARGMSRTIGFSGIGNVVSLVTRKPEWASITGASVWIDPQLKKLGVESGEWGKLLEDVVVDPGWFMGFGKAAEELVAQVARWAGTRAAKVVRLLSQAGKIAGEAVPDMENIARVAVMENRARIIEHMDFPAYAERAQQRLGPEWETFLNDSDGLLARMETKYPYVAEARAKGVPDEVIRQVVADSMHVIDELPITGHAMLVSPIPKFIPMPANKRPIWIFPIPGTGSLTPKSIASWEQVSARQTARLAVQNKTVLGTKVLNPLIQTFNYLFNHFGNLPAEIWDTARVRTDLRNAIFTSVRRGVDDIYHALSPTQDELATLARNAVTNFPDKPELAAAYLTEFRAGRNPWLTVLQGESRADEFAQTLKPKHLKAAAKLTDDEWKDVTNAVEKATETYNWTSHVVVHHNLYSEVVERADSGNFSAAGLYAGRQGLRIPADEIVLDRSVAVHQRNIESLNRELEGFVAERTAAREAGENLVVGRLTRSINARTKRIAGNEKAIAYLEELRPEVQGRTALMARARAIWEDPTIPYEIKPTKLWDEFHVPRPDGDETANKFWTPIGDPAVKRFQYPGYFPLRQEQPLTGGMPWRNFWTKAMGPRWARSERRRAFKSVEEIEAAGHDVVLDAAALMREYGAGVGRKISRAEALIDFRRKFGKRPWKEMEAEGYFIPKEAPRELGGMAYPREAYDALENYLGLRINDPSTIGKTVSTVGRMVGWPSKQMRMLYTSGRFPEYGLRNELSDDFQMFLGGYRDILLQKRVAAAKVYKLLSRERTSIGREIMEGPPGVLFTGKGNKLPGTKFTDRDLARLVVRYGIEGGGPIERAVGFSIGKQRRWWNLFDATSSMARYAEINRRIAFFIDRLNTGVHPQEAANLVGRFLYRFGELAPAEQKVMNRVLFFYPWYRKNLAFQVYSWAARPEQWSMMRALAQVARSAFPETQRLEDDEIPEYMRQYYVIPLPPVLSDRIYEGMVARDVSVAPDQQFGLAPSWAIQDWGQYDQVRSVFGMLNPAIRIPVEWIMRKKALTGREIKDLDPVRLPPYWALLPRGILQQFASEMDWPPGTGQAVAWTVPRWQRDLVYDLFPPLRKIDTLTQRLYPDGASALIDAQGFLAGSYNQVLPFSMKTWSPARLKAQEKRELADAVNDLYSFMFKQGYFAVDEGWTEQSLKETASPPEILRQYPAAPGTEDLPEIVRAQAAKLYNMRPPDGAGYAVFDAYNKDTSFDVVPFIDLNNAGQLQNFVTAAEGKGFKVEYFGIGRAPADPEGGPPRLRLTFTGIPSDEKRKALMRQPIAPAMQTPSVAPQRGVQPQSVPEAQGAPVSLPERAQAAAMAYLSGRMTGGEGQGGTAVSLAEKFLGVPYRWGQQGSKGTDCSGLTWQVYKSLGIELPRRSQEQFNEGTPVSFEELQPGDLVFYSMKADGPHHVAIYTGDGRIIDAALSKKKVVERSVTAPGPVVGARRVLR